MARSEAEQSLEDGDQRPLAVEAKHVGARVHDPAQSLGLMLAEGWEQEAHKFEDPYRVGDAEAPVLLPVWWGRPVIRQAQPPRVNLNGIGSSLRSRLLGAWRLVSREDRNAAGERRVDPGLGAEPLGLLIYDAGGNFAAQSVRRDRIDASQPSPAGGSNNTSAVNGYDAYFGTYTVDEETGTVTQSLSAALSPANVGMVVTRELNIEGDSLVIELATTRPDGEPITRTLRWTRAS